MVNTELTVVGTGAAGEEKVVILLTTCSELSRHSMLTKSLVMGQDWDSIGTVFT